MLCAFTFLNLFRDCTPLVGPHSESSSIKASKLKSHCFLSHVTSSISTPAHGNCCNDLQMLLCAVGLHRNMDPGVTPLSVTSMSDLPPEIVRQILAVHCNGEDLQCMACA